MTASAGLCVLGEMQLGLLSEKPDLKPEDLLGKPVTVTVELRDEAKRHFNGYVTRFGLGAHRGRYHGYQATVRPWLWFLTRTTDCRIFQEHDGARHRQEGVRRPRRRRLRVQAVPAATASGPTACSTARPTSTSSRRLLEHEGIY